MEKRRHINRVEDIRVKDIIRLNEIIDAIFDCTDDNLLAKVEGLLGLRIERHLDGISFIDNDKDPDWMIREE